MKKITYKIEFHTDWHCGSGLSAGADLDALVVKDNDKLPFVPGKTMKGLVREAVEDIMFFNKNQNEESFRKAFGFFDDKEQKERGEMFFSNAELQKDEREAIKKGKLQEYLYRDLARTALDDKGIAKEHSLRKIEVVVPCTLEGQIHDVPDNMVDTIEQALKYIKRLGVNRNRGLGRCTITVTNKEGGTK